MSDKIEPLTKEDGQSKDLVAENIEKLKQIFPEIVTDGKIDFEVLKEELGEFREVSDERYSFTWNGKSKAKKLAMTPSMGTLRPCPEESVNWDETEHLFIEGDNLEVLKLMQRSYHKKIKMIYLDPPYNTGNDFVYQDDYRDNLSNYFKITGQVDSEGQAKSSNPESSGRYHTDWLNMIYPRLKLCKELLADDGLVFISVDDNEFPNLRKVCDEIYGEENFIDNIIWKKRYGGGAKEKYLVTLHEYILVYAKNADNIQNIDVPLDDESIERYYTNRDSNFDERGPYRTHPLEATKSVGRREKLVYPIPGPNGEEIWPERQWWWAKERTYEALDNGELEFIERKDGSYTVATKQYLKIENGDIRRTKPFSLIDNIYTQHGTKEIQEIFGDSRVFTFPKPTELIKRFLEIADIGNGDIVADFFAASCTTADSLFQYNEEYDKSAHFIVVQLPESIEEDQDAFKEGFQTIAEIGKERIRRVIKRLNGEMKGSKSDFGFKVFKLDLSNIKPWDPSDDVQISIEDSVDNIKADRDELDVLYEILLKYGLDLTLPIEERTIDGSQIYIGGKGALVLCLDNSISLDVVEGIAEIKEELEPEIMRVVFRDSGFQDDVVKTNAIQILKQHGIEDVRSI